MSKTFTCVECGLQSNNNPNFCPQCGNNVSESKQSVKQVRLQYEQGRENKRAQKGKCARCGGPLHWYGSHMKNPDGVGKLCEKCTNQYKENQKKEQRIYTINAKNVTESEVQSLTHQYVIVNDFTSGGTTLENLMRAINLLAQNGWALAGFSTNLSPIGLQTAWAIMKKESK